METKEYLVCAARVAQDALSNPVEFLSNPDSRVHPTWAYGVVKASDHAEAIQAGYRARALGILIGQEPGDELPILYAVPLDGVEPSVTVPEPQEETEWAVAASQVEADFLEKPEEFLRNPQSRPQPSWAYGIVRANSEGQAFDMAWDAYNRGLLKGVRSGHWLNNWYVRRLDGKPSPTQDGERCG